MILKYLLVWYRRCPTVNLVGCEWKESVFYWKEICLARTWLYSISVHPFAGIKMQAELWMKLNQAVASSSLHPLSTLIQCHCSPVSVFSVHSKPLVHPLGALNPNLLGMSLFSSLFSEHLSPLSISTLKRETHLLTVVFKHNKSLRNLVDSRWTFLKFVNPVLLMWTHKYISIGVVMLLNTGYISPTLKYVLLLFVLSFCYLRYIFLKKLLRLSILLLLFVFVFII